MADRRIDRRTIALAQHHRIRLIWRQPCHEALYPRHLDGCDALRPPTSERAMAELRRRWPKYRKGIVAEQLASRLIDEAAVRRAAALEPDLRISLSEIEFGRD